MASSNGRYRRAPLDERDRSRSKARLWSEMSRPCLDRDQITRRRLETNHDCINGDLTAVSVLHAIRTNGWMFGAGRLCRLKQAVPSVRFQVSDGGRAIKSQGWSRVSGELLLVSSCSPSLSLRRSLAFVIFSCRLRAARAKISRRVSPSLWEAPSEPRMNSPPVQPP